MNPITAKKKRPDIIWVFGDRHRRQANSYDGDPNVNTPHIDGFCHSGHKFVKRYRPLRSDDSVEAPCHQADIHTKAEQIAQEGDRPFFATL